VEIGDEKIYESKRSAGSPVRFEGAGVKTHASGLVFGYGIGVRSSATVTYIVGTCKSGTQFSTIQSALDGSPAPDTVEVCPGQYPERSQLPSRLPSKASRRATQPKRES
jgi:hypothetical protein